jgi:hypothetical protein
LHQRPFSPLEINHAMSPLPRRYPMWHRSWMGLGGFSHDELQMRAEGPPCLTPSPPLIRPGPRFPLPCHLAPFWLISRPSLAACPVRCLGGSLPCVSLSSPLVWWCLVQVTVLSFTKLRIAIDTRSATENSSGTVCSLPQPFVKAVLSASLLHSRKKAVRTAPRT